MKCTCGQTRVLVKRSDRPGKKRLVCLKCRSKKIRTWRLERYHRVNREIKSGKCADCGLKKETAKMHFDHVRGRKRFNISKWHKLVGLKGLHKELAKCELVCAACHADRTAVRHWIIELKRFTHPSRVNKYVLASQKLNKLKDSNPTSYAAATRGMENHA